MTRYGTTYNNHSLPAQSNKCLSIVDFAIHPHLDNEQFPKNSMANYEKLAATLPMPSYLIDDQTAIKVIDDNIEVISEGKWKLIKPDKTTTNKSIAASGANADLVKHWGLLKRETFIGIWMLLSLALAGFVLAKAKGSYIMGFISLLTLVFSAYLFAGLVGQTDLSLLSGFPPPVSYSMHTKNNKKATAAIINDYAKAIALSREQHKPVLVDFTG